MAWQHEMLEFKKYDPPSCLSSGSGDGKTSFPPYTIGLRSLMSPRLLNRMWKFQSTSWFPLVASRSSKVRSSMHNLPRWWVNCGMITRPMDFMLSFRHHDINAVCCVKTAAGIRHGAEALKYTTKLTSSTLHPTLLVKSRLQFIKSAIMTSIFLRSQTRKVKHVFTKVWAACKLRLRRLSRHSCLAVSAATFKFSTSRHQTE